MKSFNTPTGTPDVTVLISELLIATADDSNEAIDRAVPEVLRLLREKLEMEVVFVSEFVDGKRCSVMSIAYKTHPIFLSAPPTRWKSRSASGWSMVDCLNSLPTRHPFQRPTTCPQPAFGSALI